MRNFVIRIDNRYELDCRLGGGSYGEVYQGRNLKTGQEVALKLEYNQIDPSHLEDEFIIYNKLSKGPGIPRVYWYGEECEFRVMALQLLGPNLQDLLNYCGGRFSLKTVLLLADQLIPRLQYIHSKGYIHRDIKPDNLLMGDGKEGNKVYITDIGLAKEFFPDDRHGYSIVGTVRYASIRSHLGKEQSSRDDLESLGYVLLYLLRGSLPWQGLEAESETQKNQLILERKQSAEAYGLFSDVPKEFKKYFELLRPLRFDEKPDYDVLRRLFRDLFRREGYEYNYIFDWTELKYLEHLEK